MEPFATKEQMAARSQGAIPASTPFLEDELKAATELIRGYCRWHIATSEADLVYRSRTRFAEEIWLPAMQITALQEVSLNGAAVADPASIDFDPATGWVNIRSTAALIKFTAGYETVPADIVSLTLQIAARALGSPLGFVREQAGGVGVTHSQIASNVSGGSVLFPHEMAQLDAYRIGWLA